MFANFTEAMLELFVTSLWETIVMVGISGVVGALLGIPLGVFLRLTDHGGVLENGPVNKLVGWVVNAVRSTPFIILLVAIIPLTRFVTGSSIGTAAAVVPLTIAAAPFVARLVESALREVDHGLVEAAQAMGAKVTGGPNWLEVQRGAWPLKAIDLDCNHIPDAAMTLAVMALYATGTTTLRNIASWRVKETDRIAAMANELRKLGATVQEGADYIQITPPASTEHWKAASIHTYDDHRVAMCFSLATFNPAQLPVRIEDPKCVAKTFPDYFEAFLGTAVLPAQRIPVICIDGPTASGKGTVAAEVAKRLGYHFLDSGAMYRITAYAALQAGLVIDPAHETAIAQLAKSLPVRFDGGRVYLGNEDVTDAIRTEEAGMNASKVSALPTVRLALEALQHSFRQLPGLVADGRDMGTVIFPNAPLKVYLTASAACRAASMRWSRIASTPWVSTSTPRRCRCSPGSRG